MDKGIFVLLTLIGLNEFSGSRDSVAVIVSSHIWIHAEGDPEIQEL